MKHIQIFTLLSFMLMCMQNISCTTHRLTKEDLVGTYISHVSVSPHRYTTNIAIDSVTGLKYSTFYKDMDKYIEGDTGNYTCTHFIYKRFIPKFLILNKDGTFVCSYINYGCSSRGHWDLMAVDNTLLLSFEQMPKDSIYVYSRLLEQCPYPYEGLRQLGIINANKLKFECPVFNGPKNYKEVTVLKRQKRSVQ